MTNSQKGGKDAVGEVGEEGVGETVGVAPAGENANGDCGNVKDNAKSRVEDFVGEVASGVGDKITVEDLRRARAFLKATSVEIGEGTYLVLEPLE